MRVRPALASLIALGFLAVAASGATPLVTPEVRLPTNSLATPAALDHADALTTGLLDASPGDAFRLIAAEAGYHGAAALPLAPPHDALRTAGVDPGALPPELVVPVGRLMAAIQAAESLRAEAVAGLTAAETALVLSGELYAYDETPPQPAAGASAGLVTFTPRHSDQERAAIAAKVDMDKMVAGAALILDTVRDVLPMLPAVPHGVGGTLGDRDVAARGYRDVFTPFPPTPCGALGGTPR